MSAASKSSNPKNVGNNLKFKVIAFILPFAILLLIEISLRIAGYGNDLRLFKTDQTGKFYYMNPQIGKRYFTQEINATNGNMDFFKKEKTPGTLRIFVLGSSTAFGFPYMYNGAFPRMLKYRLQRQYPELNIEMVNLSMAAINSYAVLDMAKEISGYQPDAVLIYTGQNEYHGTLGVASSSKFGNHPFLINLFIKSKQTRLMQLIYNTIYAPKKNSTSTDLNLTLMERLASGQQIPYGSNNYQAGLKQFERNVGKILDLSFAKKNPVFIGTLVSNKKGIHPFASELSKPEISGEWLQLFENGKLAFQNKDTIRTIELLSKANKLDSTYAECHFTLGEIYYSKGDFKTAQKYFTNAKELDQIRFRAPESFNPIIRKIAEGRKEVRVVEIEATFESASPHQIVGEELMLEHVHPNLSGYYLMADAYFNAIRASNLVKNSRFNNIPDELIKAQMPLTSFDTVYGYISNILLKENWPFNEPLPDPTPAEQTYEGKVAGGLAVKQYSWEVAMEKLFTYYFQKADFANALRVAEGQCLESPFQITFFERSAKLAQKLDDDDRALFYLLKIWNGFVQNIEIAQQLVTTCLNTDQPNLSVPYINYLVLNTSQNEHLVRMKKVIENIIKQQNLLKTQPDNVAVIHSIADLYLQAKNHKGAQKYIYLLLKADPKNEDIKRLQDQMNKINS